MSLVTIALPVRPHLQKYTLKEFPGVLSLKDPLGIVVYHMLKNSKGDRPDDLIRETFNSTLYIEVKEFYLLRKYISPYLDRNSIAHLDTVLDHYFKRDMFRFVDAEALKGVERRIAIDKFCEMYGIYENDIGFDTLKKAEYRNRMDRLTKKAA
jgi:hypothetical protein